MIRRVSLASFSFVCSAALLSLLFFLCSAALLSLLFFVCSAALLSLLFFVCFAAFLSLLLVCVEHGLKKGHELETSGTARPLMF